jgi:hypothetical protein
MTHEEVHRDNAIRMVAKERCPCEGGPYSRHVLGEAGLADAGRGRLYCQAKVGTDQTRKFDEHKTQRAALQPASRNLEQNSSSGFLIRGLQVRVLLGSPTAFPHAESTQQKRSQ